MTYLPPPAALPPGSVVDCYVRDSGGLRQEQSTDQQLRQIEAFCIQHGLTLRHRFIDAARSGGATVGREEFERMVETYKEPSARPHGLLLWNYARFARNFDDAVYFKATLRGIYQMVIHSLNDPIPEGDYGRIAEFFIDFSNEEKRKQTSKDTKRGLRELVEKYGCVPGVPPRGFKREPVHIGIHRDGTPRTAHRWVPDPDLAPRVLRAFQMRAAGASLHAINQETRLYKSQNCYATFWPNKLYIGILEYGGIVVEGYCAPIVPRDLWDKVQQVQNHYTPAASRNSGSIHDPRRANSRFLLSGLAKCGLCGSPLFGRSSKNRSGSLSDSYICTRAYRNRDCTKARIPRAILEDEVQRLMRDVVLHPENMLQVAEALRLGQSDQLEADRRRQSELTRDLATVRRQIENVTDAIAERSKSPALLSRLAALEQKHADLVLAQSEHTRTALQPLPDIPPELLRHILDDMRATLAEGDPAERQFLLRALLHEVRVKREGNTLRGQIEYFYPPESPPKAHGPADKRAVSTPRTSSGPPFRRHSTIVIFERRIKKLPSK